MDYVFVLICHKCQASFQLLLITCKDFNMNAKINIFGYMTNDNNIDNLQQFKPSTKLFFLCSSSVTS